MAIDKYLSLVNGLQIEKAPVAIGVGAADDGRLVALLPTGKISSTLLPDPAALTSEFAFTESNVVGMEILR